MRRGQSTVEWMLLGSVLSVGLALAAYAFIPGFRQGIDGLDDDLGSLYRQAETNGSGDMR